MRANELIADRFRARVCVRDGRVNWRWADGRVPRELHNEQWSLPVLRLLKRAPGEKITRWPRDKLVVRVGPCRSTRDERQSSRTASVAFRSRRKKYTRDAVLINRFTRCLCTLRSIQYEIHRISIHWKRAYCIYCRLILILFRSESAEYMFLILYNLLQFNFAINFVTIIFKFTWYKNVNCKNLCISR